MAMSASGCLSSRSQTFTASCPLHKVLIRQVSLAPLCGCRTNSEQPLKQEMIATVQRQPESKYGYQWKSTGLEKQHFCCCCCCWPELHGYSQCPIVTVKYQKLFIASLSLYIYTCLVIVVQPFVDQLHTKCSLVMDAAIIHSCWSLLYSAILHSQADSLRSHMILHEWLAFYGMFLNNHQSGVLTALTWLVPHETAAFGVFCVQHTTMHHVTSCKATYIKSMCV